MRLVRGRRSAHAPSCDLLTLPGLEVDLGRLADYFADILENEFDSEIDMDILNAVRELLLHHHLSSSSSTTTTVKLLI